MLIANSVGVIGLNGPRRMAEWRLGYLGREFRYGKGDQSAPLRNHGKLWATGKSRGIDVQCCALLCVSYPVPCK